MCGEQIRRRVTKVVRSRDAGVLYTIPSGDLFVIERSQGNIIRICQF